MYYRQERRGKETQTGKGNTESLREIETRDEKRYTDKGIDKDIDRDI